MVKIIDLSVKLEDFMPSHKNLRRPFVKPHVTHEDSKSRKLGTPEDPMTFTTTFMAMVDHTGTHVDAFYHNNPDGLPVDEMPLEMFMGKAVVLDLRHIPDLGDTDVKDLEAAERQAGVRIDGHIVLICWGFHARHYPNDSASHSNPGITAAATHCTSSARACRRTTCTRTSGTTWPPHASRHRRVKCASKPSRVATESPRR